MIVPPGPGGFAFSDSADGDIRNDAGARHSLSSRLDISSDWAYLNQVHGSHVVKVEGPGNAGDGDAIWTSEPHLPVGVFTADCFAVGLRAAGAVGVAHAGWRGARAEVVPALISAMTAGGHEPIAAFVGPGIGSCCFEVGDEVAAEFEGHVGFTTWGTTSVDLAGVVDQQLGGLPLWSAGACTMHETGWFSHRRDQTTDRLAAVGWL